MNYAPPRKDSKKIKLLILIACIAFIGIGVGIYFKMNQEESVIERYRVCGLSEEETIAKLHQESNKVFMIRDYFYYGESLNFYEHPYTPLNTDTLSGKTIELKNICDGTTISMTLENTLDQKLLLDSIPVGFYEVGIIENLEYKRLVFEEKLSDNQFYTAKRDGKVKKIQLIANKNLLQEYGIEMNYHYLYLSVSEDSRDNGEVDVFIDPYGMNTDFTWLPDEGNEAHGLVENKEMWEAANILKEELENEYGLRVALSKDSVDESGRAYGEDGRLIKGYNVNAKYYLMLRLNVHGDDSIRGLELHHSHYTSRILARNITYHVKKKLNYPLSPLYYGEDEGIITSLLTKGKDGNLIYDTNLYLRESGGRGTLCAKYSEMSETENSSFANKNGMYGLEIDFAYISNAEDAAYWKSNKRVLIKEIAKAFAEGINASK